MNRITSITATSSPWRCITLERYLTAFARNMQVLTGRDYPMLDQYRMEDAEVAVFLMNSASEIIKDVVDQLRAKGH